MNFYEILKSKVNTNCVLSVYSNPTDEYKCGVGFVEAVDQDFFVLRHISDEGAYDGYVLKRIENIFRIDADCEYEQRYKKLYLLNGKLHEAFITDTRDLLIDFTKQAKNRNLVVGVGIRDYDEKSTGGLVHEIDCENQIITIQEISDNGEATGLVYFNFDSVYRMSCDTEFERRLKLLYDNYN